MQAKGNLRRSAVTYVVLCACLLAAGVGAWIAAKDTAEVRMQPTTGLTTAAPTAASPAAVPVRDVPIPVETQIETETETTEAQKKYVYPLGTYIVKDYSHGSVVYSATMEDWRIHSGVDFGDNRGQSVLAMADGTVTEVTEDALWGVTVTIDHGDGVVARYCGLEKDALPAKGEAVERGAVIGTLGEIPIEAKDGPHLHLEVIVNGAQTDPLAVLRRQD